MISIRLAGIGDVENISALLRNLSKEFIVPEFTQAGREYFLNQLLVENIKKRLAGDYRFWVAEDGGNLVAVAAVRGNALLYYLFVAKPYQRKGVGRHLWLTVKDDCMARGNPGQMKVNSSTFAVSFYEQLGFAPAGPLREDNGVLYLPMEWRAG